MTKRIWILGAVGLIVIAAAATYGLFQTPAAPSAPISAVPLALEANPTEAAAPAASAAAAPGPLLFEIDPAASVARFELDEELRGAPKTVVGATDQVAGQIAFDPADLASAQVGTIQVNARDLATDSNLRDRALQNQILRTGNYEFITFEPTAVEGLPAAAAVGDTVEFTIAGDLTIRDVTRAVTFTARVTFVSAAQLSGTAAATISRDNFGLTIPSVPQVANVEEEVALIIDFSAVASA